MTQLVTRPGRTPVTARPAPQDTANQALAGILAGARRGALPPLQWTIPTTGAELRGMVVVTGSAAAAKKTFTAWAGFLSVSQIQESRKSDTTTLTGWCNRQDGRTGALVRVILTVTLKDPITPKESS